MTEIFSILEFFKSLNISVSVLTKFENSGTQKPIDNLLTNKIN